MTANWAKIDVNYLTNPKLRAAGRQHKLAPLVHLEAILYSADHKTDGVADVEVILWNTRAPKTALKACIDAGLLTDNGDGTVTVHDYTKHQTPASDIEETRQARAAAGRAGAAARWGKQDTKSDGKPHGKSHSNRMANRNANRNGTAMPRREENRKEVEIEEREREYDPAPAPESSSLVKALADALTGAGVPHTVTDDWHSSMSALVGTHGATAVKDTIAHIGTDPFWTTTITHPSRIGKNWATLQAQATRTRATSTTSTTSSTTSAPEEPDDLPPGLLTSIERDLWTQTWRKHRRAGMSRRDAHLSACAELNIAPVIDMKERLA